MNAKSFAKIVGLVAISVVVATLLLGGSKDANSFGFVGLSVATFWGIPAIVVITLYRYVESAIMVADHQGLQAAEPVRRDSVLYP